MTSPLILLGVLVLYGLGIVLAVIFVLSHRRVAAAHQELASAHKEIAKQLANIAIELKHKDSK